MKAAVFALLLAAPAAAQQPTLAAQYSGEDLAYCAGMFGKLRELDPGMVSVIPTSVDAMLLAEAANRTPSWKLGVPVKTASMRGASDARTLMRQQGLLDFGKTETGPAGAGGGLARCWTMVEPFLMKK